MLEQFGREWHVPTDEVGENGILLGMVLGQPLCIDPRNTYINVFGEGDDSCYNQVVHTLPTGQMLIMPLSHPNLDRWREQLMNGGYPVYHTPEPGSDVIAWHDEIAESDYGEEL